MSLHHGLRSPRAGLAGLTLAVVFALACRDGDPSGPPPDPLAGLTEAQRGDTDTAPSPEPGGNHEPGQIVGTIGGYEIGPGNDTVGTGVRLAGVRVTAYERLGSGGEVTAGEKRAEVTSDENGDFRLPPLPADEYVVTFVPPTTLPYRSGWTVGEAWSGSAESPWLIMLRKT